MGLDALHASRQIRVQVAALEASGAEQFVKTVALKSHEREILLRNLRIEHQLVPVRVGQGIHGAQDVECKPVPLQC